MDINNFYINTNTSEEEINPAESRKIEETMFKARERRKETLRKFIQDYGSSPALSDMMPEFKRLFENCMAIDNRDRILYMNGASKSKGGIPVSHSEDYNQICDQLLDMYKEMKARLKRNSISII